MFCKSKPNACQFRLHAIFLAAVVVPFVVLVLTVASGFPLIALIMDLTYMVNLPASVYNRLTFLSSQSDF